MPSETDLRLPSGRMGVEEIVVSGPGEGPKQIRMHWYSLRIKREKGWGRTTVDEGCHNRRDTAGNPEGLRQRRRRLPVRSMPVSPAERDYPQRRWRTASTSDRSSSESSCAPPQCSLWKHHENI